MEPQVDKEVDKNNSLAPILRWSSLSSSMGGSSTGTPIKSNSSVNEPNKSIDSIDNEIDKISTEGIPLFALPAATSSSIPDINIDSPLRSIDADVEDEDVTVLQNLEPRIISDDNTGNINDGVKFDVPYSDDSIDSSTGSFTDEEEENVKSKPKIPDGGWGWMVVFSSLVISMIADGISFSFGLLYIQFLRYFQESKSKTSWIGSLFMAVPLMSGPIGSALVDRYGCRWMTIVGGIISGAGFLMSAFCDTILMMYLTFGVVAGLGLGLCYVTAVVSIAYWFDKKRSLATGLGACGTGVGTVVYAPMTQYFIEVYGWRGTVIMLAGTFLNMCVCGALMRDPDWWIKEQQKNSGLSKSIRGSSTASLATAADIQAIEDVKELLKSGRSPEYVLTRLTTNIAKSPPMPVIQEGTTSIENNTKSNVQSVYNLPTYVCQNEKVPSEVLASLCSNNKVFNIILENYPSLLTCKSLSDSGKLNQAGDRQLMKLTSRVPVTMRVTTTPDNQQQITGILTGNPDSATTTLLPSTVNAIVGKIAKDESKVFPAENSAAILKKRQSVYKADHPHYLKDIRVHRNSVMYRGAVLNTHKYRLKASSCPNIFRNSMTTLAKETEETWKTELKEVLGNMCDFSMFLELHFMLMSIGTILLFTWFIVPYFYLAEHMTRHNYTENEASNIISIIGFTNTVGMVGLGYLGDQPWLDVTKAYAACLTACGIATCGMPLFTDSYWLLVTSAALWGLFFASNFSFTPPIIVKLIPLERFTTAYGLILLCQGIGNLLGPPLAGWVFDVTGYWDWSFYLAGFWIIISGILIALIPYTENKIIWGSGTLERDKDSIA